MNIVGAKRLQDYENSRLLIDRREAEELRQNGMSTDHYTLRREMPEFMNGHPRQAKRASVRMN
jgi:hypothetical protein